MLVAPIGAPKAIQPLSVTLLNLYAWSLIGIIFIALCVFGAVKRTAQNQRGVIFRLGRFHAMQQPGISLLIPFIDTLINVDLDEQLPGWRRHSEGELLRRLKDGVLNEPDFVRGSRFWI